jgi:predicted HTH domain antitoxin
MVIEIPDSVLKQTPHYAKPEMIKIDFAVWLYEKEVLTLAQAARLCGQTRLQFQKTLKSKGVYLNFDSTDLKIDIENI